jgi:hypothetical protein
MRHFTQAVPTQFRRSPLLAFALVVFVVFTAWKISEYIVAGQTGNLFFVGLGFAALVLVVAILNDWRNGLYFFLAWLLFEDLARKYLSNNMAIYFGKDFLVTVVYLSFFAASRRKEIQIFRPPFLIPLLLFVWFGAIQVFNPASSSLLYGVLGLKLYFYYVPLIFVGYALFETEGDLRRFFSINLFLAVLIAGLGSAQAILGHTFLNPERPAEDIRELSQLYRVAPVSGVIIYRPTSVFVSDGRFASYMILAWLIAFGVGGYLLLRSRRGRLRASLILAVISAGVILSGSRGAVLWTTGSALVCAAAFLWGAPWRQGEALRVMRTIQRALLVSGLAIVMLFFAYPEALLSRVAFYSETLSLDSPYSELVYRVRDYPLQNFLKAFTYDRWPYGFGIGTASLGAQYVSRIMHAPPMSIGVENGYGSMVIEMGIVGLALWLSMSFAVVFACWRIVRRLKGSPWFPIGFVIFWFAFLLLFPFTFNGLQPYQNFVLNAYLWLLVGILFRLPSVALSAQFAANAPSAQPHRRWIR